MNATTSIARPRYTRKIVVKPMPEFVVYFDHAEGCWATGLGSHKFLITGFQDPGNPMPVIHFIQDLFNGSVVIKVQL